MRPYRITFTVTGSGRFPLDMLRYDACYPVTSSDVQRIEDTSDVRAGNVEGIRLAHVGERTWLPTDGRWRSFLWSVDPQSIDVYALP